MNKQQCPYDKHLRDRVVYRRVVYGETYADISYYYGGRPCRRTVLRICNEYYEHRRVIRKRGRKGIEHSGTRKFDILAWEVLMEIVAADPQALLKEMAELMTFRLGDSWSEKDVSRALHESGFVQNQVFNRARLWFLFA